MLQKSKPSISYSHAFVSKAIPFFVNGKKQLQSFFIRAFLLACIIAPLSIHAQEAGCLDSDTLYVKINTAPPAITATAASFTNCTSGVYTYQWQMSTDNVHYTDIPGATSQNLNYTSPITQTIYFLRKATCGNVTKFTNSVVVFPVYTVCEDFGLSLAGTSGNAVATINAGLITTTTSSTIGEYVIEWYRDVIDGTPEFTSGSAGATDPAVTVSHPFTGEPAEGGTWHPVIKYIYIDNIKYSRNAMSGANHSPDLLHCLDSTTVIVDNLSCSNGSSFITQGLTYHHKITYTNGLVSSALASRSIRFNLDSTNKYFAWFFNGFTVADSLKITYVSPANDTSVVLDYWKIGLNAGTSDVTVTPKNWTGQGYMNKAISLNQFVFASGDYLKIEIAPGASGNTNWEFYIRCFDSLACNIWDSGVRTIQPNSVAMTWNSTLCRYEVTYNRTTWSNPTGSNFLAYHYTNTFLAGGSIEGSSPSQSQAKLILRKLTNGQNVATHQYLNCAAQSGSSTITKSGNVVTAVFSNVNDYNFHKSSYQTATSVTGMTNYSSDNTSINHYKFFLFHFIVGSGCGDDKVDKYFYTHYSNPPVFDDGTMTITLNLAAVTNNYVPINSCDNTSLFIGSSISSLNAGMSLADFSSSTSVRADTYPIIGIYTTQNTLDETANPITFTGSVKMPGVDVCDLSTKGWSATRGLNGFQWQFDLIWDRVTVTNQADPINNFKLERLMDNNGVPLSPGNYIIVYEIINGVVQ